MNGAESLVGTLVDHGVDVCFSNPGTSEMSFVTALSAEPRMRCVPALFEGVAAGAADGYYRMGQRPAATLLHLGPGLANALSAIHNAKKAASGIVNVVGDHPIPHLALDAPLTSDIIGLSRPMSHWVRSSTSAKLLGADCAEAIATAKEGRITTLIVPGDIAWSHGGETGRAMPSQPQETSGPVDLEPACEALKKGPAALLLLGGRALTVEALEAAHAISAKTGCKVMAEWSNSRHERGGEVPAVERIPYGIDDAINLLAAFEALVLVGSRCPVAFYARSDRPGTPVRPDAQIVRQPTAAASCYRYLEMLVAATNADISGSHPTLEGTVPPIPRGPISNQGLAAVIATCLPQGAIVVNESITSGQHLFSMTAKSAQHTWLDNMGGSIGFAMPVAIGAAIACPIRPVIALVGDGSAMYTLQSLWTIARENLNVTTVIFSNHKYQILLNELKTFQTNYQKHRAIDMLTLDRPNLDWISISKGLGVAAKRVSTCFELAASLAESFATKKPSLIEVEI